MAELLDAIQILRDGLISVENGRHYAAIPIGGQLRALLTERSKKNPPLLRQLSDTYHPDIRIFVTPFATSETTPLGDGEELRIPGTGATYSREGPAQKEISIPDLLNLVALQTTDGVYRVRDVIEHVANRAGGAHYALHVNDRIENDMSNAVFGGIPFWVWAMRDIGKSVLHIAHHLLAELLIFQVSVGLVIRGLPMRASMDILRAKNPRQMTAWTLSITAEQKLRLAVVDATGSVAAVASESPIEWSEPRYIAFSVHLSDDLSTVLKLFVDGECVGATIAPKPLYIYNDPNAYEIKINGGANPGAFGCYDIKMWKNTPIDDIVKEDASVYAAKALSDNGRCFFLPKNGRGFKQVDQSTVFEFQNNIPSLIRDVIQREFEWFSKESAD